jgi:L-asparaginase
MKQRLIAVSLATIVFSCSFQAMARTSVAVEAKPAVTILATGGTIAGSAASSADTTGYTAGTLGVDVLIKAVPEMADVAKVSGEQIVNVDSNEIDTKVLLTLAAKARELLADDAASSGIVITHGTDTLEETAFFLDLTVKSAKPIVLVGAMRPATAISADGPMNLLEAVSLAADWNARNRGVLVVLNDRISSGFYITKTHAGAVDTFKASEQGYLGTFINRKPVFYYAPTEPTAKPFFDVSKYDQLPKVVILYGHQSLDPQLLEAAVNTGAKGIVIAATGDGSISAVVQEKVKEIMAKGIPVVLSTRTGSGIVSPKEIGIAGGLYNPQKSRILLSLALADGADFNKISGYFSGQMK